MGILGSQNAAERLEGHRSLALPPQDTHLPPRTDVKCSQACTQMIRPNCPCGTRGLMLGPAARVPGALLSAPSGQLSGCRSHWLHPRRSAGPPMMVPEGTAARQPASQVSKWGHCFSLRLSV